ncbi:hypothetical protein [Pedobacter punctiformis]|uniref:Uncharacterized protein n=1 Tax=Pedobacter punctiformis TaxID=3004097 RepID=A0ABT4LAM4_9SPHI|nr:hypothetical protein [Pedobacter sp. HCMS5-2]MCZ4244974.1 hypothetical protein [Pedobacter sp. HCMS5-2]
MAKIQEPKEQPGDKYLVVQEFRDKDNFNLHYNEGENVSHFPDDRLKELVEKGLVEKK